MMADANTPPMPSYKNPPVIEVACGCRFQPLKHLKLPHVGLLWEKFRKEFPTVEHALPIGDEVTQLPPMDDATGLPWPRVWFINESESRLIQFQPNRVHFNWRRRERDPLYPRYPEIIDSFEKSFTVIQEFLNEMNLGVIDPVQYELTYINHIMQGAGWNMIEDLPNVFRDFHWLEDAGRFLPKPTNVAWQTRFTLPNNMGRLSAKLNQAATIPDSIPLLSLELLARGIGVEKTRAGMRSWFDVAHEWIVKGFADLTTRDIQTKIWKREDAAAS